MHLFQKENFLHTAQHPKIFFSLTQTKEPKVHKYQATAPHTKEETIIQTQDKVVLPKPNNKFHTTAREFPTNSRWPPPRHLKFEGNHIMFRDRPLKGLWRAIAKLASRTLNKINGHCLSVTDINFLEFSF